MFDAVSSRVAFYSWRDPRVLLRMLISKIKIKVSKEKDPQVIAELEEEIILHEQALRALKK
tara:strand:- start:216 stop:398 length:183 start_codon:yes stop_codon:yes gene_type:complete